jgi:hypothetical protein
VEVGVEARVEVGGQKEEEQKKEEEKWRKMERKVERREKYMRLVKNCIRLQCKECNKLYTPTMFQ